MIMAKDSHGNYVEIEDIKQQDSFNGISPIDFKSNGDNLKNYRIYGNTVNGESVGDRTDNIIRDYIVIQTRAQYAVVLLIDAELIPNTTYSFICLLNDSGLRLYVNENLFNTVSYVKDGIVLKIIVKTLPELSDSQKIDGKWVMLKNSVTEPVIPKLSNIMMIKGSTALPYEPYGYRVPVTITNGTDTQTTNIYLPEPIKMAGDEAEYIDYGEQKQHRVRKNLLQSTATSQTINGVTFTVNEDGSVTCNGTAQNLTYIDISTNFDTSKYEGYKATFYSDRIIHTAQTVLIRISTLSSRTAVQDILQNDTIIQNNGNSLRLSIRIASGYTCDNLTFYPMIRKADVEDDTYEPYIQDTELDVTLPALPTFSGTNALSVNTNIKPSKVWGGLNAPRDILYVKDKLGNILFSKYYEIEDEPPLTYKAKKTGTLKNYRIYGNTVDGESVGDRTGNLFDGSWENKFIDTYGNTGYSTDRVLSSYVTVIPNQTYSVKSNMHIRSVHSYNDTAHTQALIDNVAGLDGATFTIPADSNSIRISLKKANDGTITPDDVEWCMLNTGSEALPYEPYGYKVPMIIKGINLFDESVVVDKEVNTEYSNFQIYHQGGILYLNGTTTSTQADIEIAKMSSINSEMLEYINQNYGKYVFTSISPGTIQIRFLNSDSENYAYASNSYTSTSSRSANRFIFRMQKDYQYDHEPIGILIKKEQIQSVYEPYHTPTITTLYLPKQIKKVGDEAEYIDFGGQKQHKVRKNLLRNTASTKETQDYSFVVDNDGTITIDGYFTNTYDFAINGTWNSTEEIIKQGNYTLSNVGDSITSNIRVIAYNLKVNKGFLNENTSSALITNSAVTYVAIQIPSGTHINNLKLKIMICKAEITDDTYEPYIENTDLDVTLPALPTLSGTNTLSIETGIQPSDIYLKGKIEKKPKIYYYSQDGQTLLYTESVLKGSNGIYSGTPTKMADPQYTYTFAGWSSSTGQTAATPEVRNNIQNDKNVYAAFSQTLNTYTVYFYNESNTLIETVQNVPYGGTATYTGATPTKQGYSFTGWSPLPTNITADTSCYAQFEEDDMYESITDTWSQIIANVSNGTYSTKYHIGDTKKIDLGTEGEVIMTIVGIDTDDLADNSGKAPITWISKQLLKTDHRMNPEKQSGTSGTGTLGGWEACEMRSYLINTIKPLIPEAVRNAIKPVKKYSRIYNVSGSAVNDVLTTEDVWIPSFKEVFGTGRETLGPTYSTTFPDNASRIKSKAGNSAALWWLRSAGTNRYFYYVNADGSSNITNAKVTGGVALGFCT